jgi:hypothetical protein
MLTACGAQTSQRSGTSPSPQRAAEHCAALPDPLAQSQAQALASAANIFEYEAAWRRVYPAAALGGIGAAEVRRVVHAHTADLSGCYEPALAKVDQAAGRVVVRFVIDPQGGVPAAHLAKDELGVEGVGCCLVQRVAAWKFPAPEGGYAVVEYPFTVRLSHRQ